MNRRRAQENEYENAIQNYWNDNLQLRVRQYVRSVYYISSAKFSIYLMGNS
jgi:hypothetical protein